MKTALFFNFTNKPFTGFWDGKPHTFKAGEKKFMPEYLAAHFAKHLTNRELINNVTNGEKYTSPKKPEETPIFMKVFNKAFIMQEDSKEMDEAESAIDTANRKESKTNDAPKKDSTPDDDEEIAGLK